MLYNGSHLDYYGCVHPLEEVKINAITDILTLDDESVFEDDIVFVDDGIRSHRSARTTTDGVFDCFFEAFERTWCAKHAFAAMTNPETDVILEMGCAEMPLYNAFKMQFRYPNYIGVDIRRDYLTNSAHRKRKNVLGLCADLTKPLPIKDGTISAIILSEVVEHLTLEQNLVVFTDALRLLKPGGKVLVSSPVNVEGRDFHDLEKEVNLGHVFFWTIEQFKDEMLKLGFSNFDAKWGYSTSSKIKVSELKRSLHPEVASFIEDISTMYGSSVARAVALSASNVVNGGCRVTLTK